MRNEHTASKAVSFGLTRYWRTSNMPITVAAMLAMVDTKLAICAGVLGPVPLSTSFMVMNEMFALSRTVACLHDE